MLPPWRHKSGIFKSSSLGYLVVLLLSPEKKNAMQMIYCPNCQKQTGFRRALGFGTFFMVVITFGFWLFAIPLYPARCIVCGLQRKEALASNFAGWWGSRTREQKFILCGLVLAAVILVIVAGSVTQNDESSQRAVIVNGPDYNEPLQGSSERTVKQSSPSALVSGSQDSTEHQLRLMPNFSGDGASEDGRVYSVALIAGTRDIPLGTELLAQGKITRFDYAEMQSRPYAVIGDEQQSDKALMCAINEDEGTEVMSLFHVGELVAVTGNYMGSFPVARNPVMPVLRDCKVADAQNNVVRPATISSN